MIFSAYLAFGMFVGFFFGVGCSLAVMYQIFLGGYRAALKDGFAEKKSERYLRQMEKAKAELARSAQKTAP